MSFVLQPAVSRFESIRFQISDLAWNNGLQPIFLYGIPFSGRSNRLTAKRHARLLSEVYMSTLPADSTKFVVLELGACHGILTSQVLVELQENYPDIYERLTLYVCDYSPQMVEILQKNPLLQPHFEKLHFVTYEDFLKSGKHEVSPAPLEFHYIYHSYLYNAFPCRHISVTENGLCEILIETQLPKDLVLYNLETLTEISAESLFEEFQKSPQKTLQIYGRFLEPWLIEKKVEIALEGRIPHPIFEKLKTMVQENNIQEPFNFSEESINVITQLQSRLLKGGLYCFSDVTLQKGSQETRQKTKTSHCHYFPILPEIITSFTPDHSQCYTQHFPTDALADFMMASDSFFEWYKPIFLAQFSDTGLESIQAFINVIENTKPEDLSQEAFLKLTDNVGEILQTDYFFLQKSMAYAVSRDWDELALFIAELMITHFSDYAFDAYKTLAVLMMKSKTDTPPVEVLHFLEHVLSYLPDDSAAYQLLAHYYVLKKDYAQAISCLKKALPLLISPQNGADLSLSVSQRECLDLMGLLSTQLLATQLPDSEKTNQTRSFLKTHLKLAI